MRRHKIDACVEALCQKGCRAVWENIRMLGNGVIVPEADGLIQAERDAVVEELKRIMAVYGDSCRVEADSGRE